MFPKSSDNFMREYGPGTLQLSKYTKHSTSLVTSQARSVRRINRLAELNIFARTQQFGI